MQRASGLNEVIDGRFSRGVAKLGWIEFSFTEELARIESELDDLIEQIRMADHRVPDDEEKKRLFVTMNLSGVTNGFITRSVRKYLNDQRNSLTHEHHHEFDDD